MKFAYASGSRPLDGYTIKRGIGVGGFGEVYFAASDAGKEVALKRVQRHLDVELRGVTQCLNLKHPNLISLFDIKYNDEGEAWVVMEYVNGHSLKDAIDRNPNGMPHEEVNNWFRGVAAGVVYLHDHGIVHRDLKPANIFMDEDVVKIGDYGLSKFISCSRRSGQTESVGTFHYMAPEIGKGVYGKEIDIYALGVILYEMLTGRVPFDGESSQEIIMKHLTADPDLSGVGEPYREVIRQALLKDPGKRISSVREMTAALGLEGAEPDRRFRDPGPTPPPPVRSQPLQAAADPREESTKLGPVKSVSPATQTPGQSPPVGEPIAQAIREGAGRLADWWSNSNLSTPVKIIIVLGAVSLLAVSSGVWIPPAITLAVLYLIYLAIRALILALSGSAQRAPPPPVPTPAHPRAAKPPRSIRSRRGWKELARDRLHEKPSAQRLAELTGSLLMSAVVAAVLCLLMVALGGESLEGDVEAWSHYAWMTLTSVAGAWLVLTASKFWEGDEGDQALRRFVMLVQGLAVGAAAFGLAGLLEIRRFGVAQSFGLIPRHELPAGLFLFNGTPQLPGYMVFFAGLFLILCWWRQADPLRSTRFSLWKTAVSALWGFILPFPQPCGAMLAATISVAVQLSAPWVGSRERARMLDDSHSA